MKQGLSTVEFAGKRERIAESIDQVLNKLPSKQRAESNYRRENQREVLYSLDEDFVTQMRAHIYNVVRSQEERKEQGLSNSMDELERAPEEYIKGHLKGEVFEQLVAKDPAVRRSREKLDEQSAEKRKQVEAAEDVASEILAVMEDPARYNLGDKIELNRLPDAAYIDVTEEGQVIILGVGEAKSGYIGDRFVSQMKSFEEGAQVVAQELSNIRHSKRLRKLGLENLAARREDSGWEGKKYFVTVSNDFKKTLIVPADKKVQVDWESGTVDRITYASFTGYEVEAIRDWVYEEICEIDPNFRV